jgi:ParB family chromosome partitioning protein
LLERRRNVEEKKMFGCICFFLNGNTLAASIQRHGLLQPLRLRRKPDGRYEVIAGATRLPALLQLREKFALAVVVNGELSEADILEQRLDENRVRFQLTLTVEARAMDRIMKLRGWTREQTADYLGIAQGTLTKRRAVLELPTELQAKADSNGLPLDACYYLCKLGLDEMLAYAAVIEREGHTRDNWWCYGTCCMG